MRRIQRKRLPSKLAKKLRKEQQKANENLLPNTPAIQTEWERARRNAPLKTALLTLREMSGKRQRCMYCGDSHGTDIEHYWPKAPYPRRMFRWTNMLLGCTTCGRDFKGSSFPLDTNNRPLLVKPTTDDPWQHLDFDPQTGNLSPRFDAQGNPAPKGQATVDTLGLDRREALASGYQKTFKRIKKELEEIVKPTANIPSHIKQLLEHDEYGLLGWCFRGNGIYEPPMSDLKQAQPVVWAACQRAFRNI